MDEATHAMNEFHHPTDDRLTGQRRRDALVKGFALVKAIAEGRVLVVGRHAKWGVARANELESTRKRLVELATGRTNAKSGLERALLDQDAEPVGEAAEYAEYGKDYQRGEDSFLTFLRAFLSDMNLDHWYGLRE